MSPNATAALRRPVCSRTVTAGLPLHHLGGHAERGEDFEGTGLYRQRPRLVDPVG